MIVPRLYEELSVLHQNTMPVHSYFIPASRPSETDRSYSARENSDRIQMLSGSEWQFRYFASIHDLHDEFYRTDYEKDDKWKPESVPFCWQMRGYDENQYTNIRYPIPFDPPYVPQQNPCGVYLHRFKWQRNPEAPLAFLNFEGVDSCFFVWLNGEYVGYSQVTHHTSEFDVTGLLREGENLLAVCVLKWCDGSYLEDQDKFRMSGIIRDVYLLSRPEKHIRDYIITTDLSEDHRTAELGIKLCFYNERVPVKVTLRDQHGRQCCLESLKPETSAGMDGRGKETAMQGETDERYEIRMVIENPLLWTAETPNLYTLILQTQNETITERVGFRTVCVKDGVLLLNDSPIKFRGVNRHESDPVTGSVVTREQIEKDLKIIKEHNFNAVRASHYPNVPFFYQLCDEMGLYVIDEADNESHGTAPLYFKEDDYAERMKVAHERIADNPDFIEPTLDRVRSMVIRNRNRPSILVWSMGNECGYGCTFEEALRWTRATDPGRLTHYESAFYLSRDREYDVSEIDLFGRMYPAFGEVTDYLKDDPEKPLLLVEYCHSMGNSPGDFKEYRDLTEQYPRLCGGFVWEFCDHAVYKGTAGNGKAMYRYGGDHGELQHDGNFCLDGLVYPDRTPHTGLYEYKNVHRPIRSSYDPEKGILTVGNYWDFLEPSEYAEARYSLTQDGAETESGYIRLPEIAPHTRKSIPLRLTVPDSGRCYLLITYSLKREVTGLPKGHVLGFDDIRIRNSDGRNRTVTGILNKVTKSEVSENRIPNQGWLNNETEGSLPNRSIAGCTVTEKDTNLIVTGDRFAYTFDTLSGLFTSLVFNNEELLKRPLDFNLWRAPTDNDAAPADLWGWERLDHTVTRAYEVTHSQEKSAAVIRVRQSVAAISVAPILRMQTEYHAYSDGTLRMDVQATKDEQIETLPRIGFRMFLDSSLNEVEYYGIGPYESYIDKCRGGRHGVFRSDVGKMHEDYIKPQENGSHCDYVKLSGGKKSLTVAAADGQTFSFNASPYTQEELTKKRHNYELEKSGDTVLCIDHKMAGVGSKSCGPDLSEEYRVDADTYQFSFIIQPETE